jgi:hypothetical protein
MPARHGKRKRVARKDLDSVSDTESDSERVIEPRVLRPRRGGNVVAPGIILTQTERSSSPDWLDELVIQEHALRDNAEIEATGSGRTRLHGEVEKDQHEDESPQPPTKRHKSGTSVAPAGPSAAPAGPSAVPAGRSTAPAAPTRTPLPSREQSNRAAKPGPSPGLQSLLNAVARQVEAHGTTQESAELAAAAGNKAYRASKYPENIVRIVGQIGLAGDSPPPGEPRHQPASEHQALIASVMPSLAHPTFLPWLKSHAQPAAQPVVEPVPLPEPELPLQCYVQPAVQPVAPPTPVVRPAASGQPLIAVQATIPYDPNLPLQRYVQPTASQHVIPQAAVVQRAAPQMLWDFVQTPEWWINWDQQMADPRTAEAAQQLLAQEALRAMRHGQAALRMTLQELWPFTEYFGWWGSWARQMDDPRTRQAAQRYLADMVGPTARGWIALRAATASQPQTVVQPPSMRGSTRQTAARQPAAPRAAARQPAAPRHPMVETAEEQAAVSRMQALLPPLGAVTVPHRPPRRTKKDYPKGGISAAYRNGTTGRDYTPVIDFRNPKKLLPDPEWPEPVTLEEYKLERARIGVANKARRQKELRLANLHLDLEPRRKRAKKTRRQMAEEKAEMEENGRLEEEKRIKKEEEFKKWEARQAKRR